jgi:short-subunit dehydrogenase
MLARNRERLALLQREIANSHAYPSDVTDEAQLDSTLAAIRADLGTPRVLIHNTVGGAFGNFMEIEPAVLNSNFQANTMALLHLARRLAPAMIEAGEGAIIASGNTSALRGKANFAGFAPTKAAQRILAEAIAREARTKGRSRRIRLDRCGHRPGMDAQALARGARRFLHQTCRDC